MNLRENPPRLKLNTRCLFTHMIDVKPYDDLQLPYGIRRYPERWYNGTCHHLFDGGWLWVIPFNNRKGSTNPLCSVGLHYDNARFPRPKDRTPAQEWDDFLARFPSIKAQFSDAKPVREWISSDRLQTSTKQIVGERWVLTAAASGAGFIDALFSRGLATSTEVISALVPRLLKALDDDDFAPERFEYIERMQRINVANNDRLVTNCYRSFADYDLWNAWFRIWALGVGLGDLRLADALRRYTRTRDESVLPDNQEPMGLFLGNNKSYKRFFDAACDQMDLLEQGRQDTRQTTDAIFTLLRNIDFAPPTSGFGDPSVRLVNVGKPSTLVRTIKWALTEAPPEIRSQTLGTVADLAPMRLLANGNKRRRKMEPNLVPQRS
jgi:FADH2 O2-dependent halogenase